MCTSKTCRNGLAQLIDSSDESDSLASSAKALALLKERMTNHVIGSHDLVWQDASDHVNLMEPHYWTEKAATSSAVSPPTPLEAHTNECRYVMMCCPCTDKINKTCWSGLKQIVDDSIDNALSLVQTRMASHMTDVHDMSWGQACDLVHFQEATVCVEATPPESASSERRRRSRSPHGCKGGSGSGSSANASSGSKGGKDGNGGKAGKGGKGGITGKCSGGVIGARVQHIR